MKAIKIIVGAIGVYLLIGLIIATRFAVTYDPQKTSAPNNSTTFIINTVLWGTMTQTDNHMNDSKNFKLKAEEIKDLKTGMGAAYATDKITVDGEKVGFMYRQKPDNDQDSGWRFFSGTEDEAYTSNPDHISIYDVNTIANYDPSIIPYLDAPVGSAYERTGTGWTAVKDFQPAND